MKCTVLDYDRKWRLDLINPLLLLACKASNCKSIKYMSP